MCYLGIRPSVCKLREHKLWTFQVETSHANLSPGQTAPFNQCHNHRSTRGRGRRRTTCCCKNRGIRNTASAMLKPPETFGAEVPVWSVSGVLAGREPVAPADPRVLQSLGVPPRLRREELSEVETRSDESVLPNRKLWWSWPKTKYEERVCAMPLLKRRVQRQSFFALQMWPQSFYDPLWRQI